MGDGLEPEKTRITPTSSAARNRPALNDMAAFEFFDDLNHPHLWAWGLDYRNF